MNNSFDPPMDTRSDVSVRRDLARIAARTAGEAAFEAWRMTHLAIGNLGAETVLSWEIGKAIFKDPKFKGLAHRVWIEAHLSELTEQGFAPRGGSGRERIDVALIDADGRLRAALETKRHYSFGKLCGDVTRQAELVEFLKANSHLPPEIFVVGVYEKREDQRARRSIDDTERMTRQEMQEYLDTRAQQGVGLTYTVELAETAVAGEGTPGAVYGLCWPIVPVS